MSREIKRNDWGKFCKKFNSENQFRSTTLNISGENGEHATVALAPFMGVTLQKKGRQVDGIQIFTGWADPDNITRPILTVFEPSGIYLDSDRDGRDHKLTITSRTGTQVRLDLIGEKNDESERHLVSKVAYSLYERRGYADGNDMGDWLTAEQKVREAEKQLI